MEFGPDDTLDAQRMPPSTGANNMAITSAMIASTTFEVQGRRIREYKGMVRGIIVRAPTISQGILGGLKSIVGGQIGAYTEMCEQARVTAYDLMVEHAREMGANAVVGVRYDASEVGGKSAATEVLCYGTAVVLE
jgi:uncharacterized protein YbjQ (UPF0145 family)